MKRILRIAMLSLIAAALFCCALGSPDFRTPGARAYGATTYITETKELSTLSLSHKLELWHWTCGYWRCSGKGIEDQSFYDEDIYVNKKLKTVLKSPLAATLTATLPEDVQQVLKDGGSVSVKVSIPEDMVVSGSVKCSISKKTTLNLSFKPIFNFSAKANLSTYLSGIRFCVPMIDNKYGHNAYNIYGNGVSHVRGDGWFTEEDIMATKKPYVHPTQIKNRYGYFKDGYTINLKGKAVKSNGYIAGNGTSSNALYNAQPTGLVFLYPITVTFTTTVTREVTTETPDVPDNPIIPDSPAIPENPVIPAPPADDPNSPNVPIIPDEPGSSDNPQNPGSPDTPESPMIPENPVIPAPPTENPEIPDQPSNKDPDNPDNPSNIKTGGYLRLHRFW